MPSTQFQIFPLYSYSRRFLHQQPLPASPPTTANYPPPPPGSYAGDNHFDANVVMVLSVLLCALICSLGLNSIVRCALRCSRIGAGGRSARLANTGVKKKALKTFPVVNFSAELDLPGLDSDCVICLSEFSDGERVRILPKCNHGFHLRCIDKWLNSHSSCPTCRHCLIETCHKIVSHCGQSTGSQLPAPAPVTAALVVAPPQESVVRILPLEHEGLVRNYET